VLARIGERVITEADLEAKIATFATAYERARYRAPAQRKELLENLVRFEVLALTAKQRGYDRDPEAQRASRERLVAELVRRELDGKLRPEDVPDEEARRLYEAHRADFVQAEEVRASQILVADRQGAEEVARLARAAGDDEAFRALVEARSLDEDSKPRGGDLTFFPRDTTLHPRALVDAAFTLTRVGEVSPPIQTDRGFHVLKLTGRRPRFTRPFEEVRSIIRQRLLAERRARQLAAWDEEMRKTIKIEIYEDRLAQVKIDAAPRERDAAPRSEAAGR
jgi:peptidyl-prolyl cis-trans isomerase C